MDSQLLLKGMLPPSEKFALGIKQNDKLSDNEKNAYIK